jgi:hypothetical protein
MALLEVEQKMRRIDHAEHLVQLRKVLLEHIDQQKPSAMGPFAEESFN